MNKLYVYAVIALAALAGAWHYNNVIDELDKLAADNAIITKNLESQKAVIAAERSAAIEANSRATETQKKSQEVTDEVNNLRACIDAGTCGVRWKYQACPRVSGSDAAASRSAIDEADAARRREFEQNYFNLVESIRQTRVQVEALQEDVRVRSRPDYCSAKK